MERDPRATVFRPQMECYDKDDREDHGPPRRDLPHSSVAQWQSIRLLTGGL